MGIICTEAAVIVRCPDEDIPRIRDMLNKLRPLIEQEIERGDETREKDREDAEVSVHILKEWVSKSI